MLGRWGVCTELHHRGDGGALRPSDASGPDGAGVLPGLYAGAAAHFGAVEVREMMQSMVKAAGRLPFSLPKSLLTSCLRFQNFQKVLKSIDLS